jgi:tetratricopeptide (TPR) repeat protein
MRFWLYILTIHCLLLSFSQNTAAQTPGPPKPRDTTIAGPQTFAIIMGISKYKYVRPLTYADKDAEMFRDYLKSPSGGKVPNDNIFMLLNEEAMSTTFWQKGFKWLEAKKLQKGDKLFFYLAGHGDAIDEDQFFYIAYDCNPAGDKNNYLAGGTIQLFNLKKKMAKETQKGVEVFFIMDACRTSELPGGSEGQNFLNSAISEKRVGEIIMLATGAGQESLEDASIGSGHGLFTYYLIDGLNGMADKDSEKPDNQVSLSEIQKYIDKNVPNIAKTVFKRKQDPYFCCTENSDKIVSIVDTAYLRKWLDLKRQQSKGGVQSVAPRGRSVFGTADTLVIEAYNLFNAAIKESRLTGAKSAEYYYDLLARKFPGNSYTIDAQSTLAVEFINFAQSKINLYLDCKDAATIQRIRAQIDEDEKTDETLTSLNRMEKVAQLEFYEVGRMLEKAIIFIMPDDPDFAESLRGRMYFFKARGYFNRSKKMLDISKAFEYAYSAYAADKNAAYVLNTISSLHLDNNKYDSSIIYAKRAITTAPKWRYPYVTLAFCYKTMNRPDSAIKYYQKSIEVDPGNADAYVDLGHYYYSLSKAELAVANYEKALAIEPSNIYASNNLGWLYHDAKKYKEAIAYFKRSINADARFVNPYNGIAKTFFEIKQYDSARIYYSKAFSNYQDKSIVNVYIGNFYRDLKQYDSAKTYYRLAADLDPNYEEAYNDLGKASFDLKQYDSAVYYYRKALVVNPYSAFALINTGMVYKELKRKDSTVYYFEQAVQAEPGNPSILNNLGVIFGQEKSYDTARIYFRRALQVRPDYKPASNNLIKIFKEQNLLDSVTNFLKGSSQIDPNSPQYASDMGMAFLDQKRYDSARVYLHKAIAKDPDNAQYLSNMGLVFNGMKRYDSARIYLQKANRIDGGNAVIWLNLSTVFKQLKQADSAAFYYKKHLYKKAVPNAQFYFSIGNFYDDLKLYDSAIANFKQAVAIDPNYYLGYTEAGNTYLKMEMYDSARNNFSRAVAIKPDYPVANLNLGLVYHSTGQYDLAAVHIQKAIRLEPDKAKNYYLLATSYALGKKPDQAIQNLKIAYEKGYKNTDNLVNDPDLFSLKDIKEFQALLDKYVPGWKNR